MRRSSRLAKLVALAESEERRLGAITGESQTHVAAQAGKLRDLDNYRQNYAAKPLPTGAVAARHWHDYHGFLSKLDRAIEAQRQIVSDSERNLQLHRKRWMEERRKRESLQNMHGKASERERIARDRLEQKQQDELSQSSFVRRATAD